MEQSNRLYRTGDSPVLFMRWCIRLLGKLVGQRFAEFWGLGRYRMDASGKERLIARISWGDTPATVITQNGTRVSFLLHSPTPKEQAQAATVYSVEYQHGIIMGLSPRESIISDMIALGRWSHQKEIEIDGLQKDIYKIRHGLLDFLFNETKLEKARTLLRRAESALLERLSQKHDLTQDSAEAHALIGQQRRLIYYITEDEDGRPFWETKSDFEQCEDIGIITQLCELFFRQSRISTKLIRELARSQQWREYWAIAKNTNDLFDNSVLSWSPNQIELSYWSTIYDSVYDAFERPSQKIIVDDDLLDSWFLRQNDKMEARTGKELIADKGSHKAGRQEQFVVSDEQGAKQVYGINDPISRATIQARQNVLQKNSRVLEQDMPNSQREMQQQLMQMRQRHGKDIRRKG